MTKKDILAEIGMFSEADLEMFDSCTTSRACKKNETILHEGQICTAFNFIRSGSFFQYKIVDIDEAIIDLHTPGEWMYNHRSLIGQKPSDTAIKAFDNSEILQLTIHDFHYLASRSSSFLQFNGILDQGKDRTYIFDNAMDPLEKYAHIIKAKPQMVKIFPIKMIASYLKIAPETLSRVRAKQ